MATLRKIAGVTRLDGNIAQATLRLYDAATGALRAETQSDAGTGEYAFVDVTGEVMGVGETFFVLSDYGSGVRPLAHGPISPVDQDAALWTPAEATIAVWLDALDESTFTLNASSGVTQWRDKSGNAAHFAQNASNPVPLKLSDGVLFSNPDAPVTSISLVQHLSRSGVLLTPTPFCVFCVGSYTGTRAGHFIGGYNSSTRYAAIGIVPTAVRAISRNTTYYAASVDCDWSNARKNIVRGIWESSGARTMAQNGGVAEENASSSTDIPATGTTFLGLDRLPNTTYDGSPLVGTINELLILNYVPSDDLSKKIEGYLAFKWGLRAELPPAHPYKIEPPYLT